MLGFACKASPLGAGYTFCQEQSYRGRTASSVHVQLGIVRVHAGQGRAAPRPCSDAPGMAVGRGGLSGEIRCPGTGRRATVSRNTNPNPLVCCEFLWHWALFTGQGVNASPGPPARPLCSTAKLQALGSNVSGQRAMSSSVMTSLVVNWKAKLTQ